MLKYFIKHKKFDNIRFKYLVKARDNINTLLYSWTTFFSVAIGALFVGYYTMASNIKPLKVEIVVVSLVGYFVSLIWHWSCKGYYWWVKNWINLVMDCEQNLPPQSRIYSCFFNKKNEGVYCNPVEPANISTGRLLGLFSFVVTLVWGFLFLYTVLKNYFCISSLICYYAELFCLEKNWAELLIYFGCFFISLIITIFLCCFAEKFKHDMKKHKEGNSACPTGLAQH
jgi:hypothetical protein